MVIRDAVQHREQGRSGELPRRVRHVSANSPTVAPGSSIQIALFIAPLLVLAGPLVAGHPLTLAFTRAEVGALFLAVLIGVLVGGDGRSNWFKGV